MTPDWVLAEMRIEPDQPERSIGWTSQPAPVQTIDSLLDVLMPNRVGGEKVGLRVYAAERRTRAARVALEQAIARGESTSRIMTELGVGYETVQIARERAA
jgi:hypothetical protein